MDTYIYNAYIINTYIICDVKYGIIAQSGMNLVMQFILALNSYLYFLTASITVMSHQVWVNFALNIHSIVK